MPASHSLAENMEIAIFLLFAGVAIVSAANILIQRHPIYSALSLIVTFIALAGIYLQMHAEFIAVMQIVVYTGAIMVLFIFVIMLLNAGEEEHSGGSRVAAVLGYPAVALLVGLVAWAVVRSSGSAGLKLGGFVGSTEGIGYLLFRGFLLPFEVTSVLILIAIMGAVVLARKED